MIKEQEAGVPAAELCRRHGLSEGAFCGYQLYYGGMEVFDVATLRTFE